VGYGRVLVTCEAEARRANGLAGSAELIKRGNLRMLSAGSAAALLSVVGGALFGAGYMERWGP